MEVHQLDAGTNEANKFHENEHKFDKIKEQTKSTVFNICNTAKAALFNVFRKKNQSYSKRKNRLASDRSKENLSKLIANDIKHLNLGIINQKAPLM